MSIINLEKINVSYPVLDDHYMSIRRAILRLVTAGRMYRQDGQSRIVHALKDLTLEIHEGDRIGLIGRNGAGKSTLLKTIGGFITPDNGLFRLDGTVTALFSINGGMDVERTGYDNIYLIGRLLGIRRKEMETHIADIESFTELGEFLSMPVRAYSDGMKVRLALAVVTCVHPDILVLDEALGAGDAHFIEKTMHRVQKFYDRARIIVMASHDPSIIRRLCNKAVWLEKGTIRQVGPVDDVLSAYTTSG